MLNSWFYSLLSSLLGFINKEMASEAINDTRRGHLRVLLLDLLSVFPPPDCTQPFSSMKSNAK
jgi:hypothetical protein